VAVVGSVAVLTYNAYNNFALLIDQQIAAGYLKSHAGLYAAPRIIEKGARLTKEQLIVALQRAGYGREKASNIWNGSFQIADQSILILPRQNSETHQWIKVSFDNDNRIASLSANDYSNLQSYALEPELLTEDAANKTGQQETLTFQDIPPVLVQAVLAIEDRRFFQHNGLDPRGIGRAFVSLFTRRSSRYTQGGSTITQQLVKNTYLSSEKTLRRKFNEALIAMALEHRLSKQDIFALYCNEIYLGQRNGVGVRGVAQAAKVFFGKELKDISLVEAATIAGMIQSPARYAPDRNAEASRLRRDKVIDAMTQEGMIDENAGLSVRALPVSVAPFKGNSNELAPYYVDAVNRAMDQAQLSPDSDSEQSVRVQTTIDPDLQQAAENALRHQIEMVGKTAKGGVLPQGAIVALDPGTGQVLAMVGGRSYEESQLNRATDAKRQPGSVFKPFVYAAALESGISPLATFRDAPQTFQNGYGTYSPANFGGGYSMHDVIMREGLIRSLNVVTVDLAIRTGLSRVANFAADFGLPQPEAYPALALGTTEVTPLQIAAAYAAFANGGNAVTPTVIARVVDNNSGDRLVEGATTSRQVIKPTTAYMITDMLSDVIRRGTAARANGIFKNVAIAGKTGTSRDGWFVGYTPNLVCAVWIGFDDNKQLGLTGAEAALPAWIDFMKEALAIRPSLGGTFSKPSGITTVKVDPETGWLAGPNCPSAVTVKVAYNFAPVAECYKHAPVEPALYEYSDSSEPEGALVPGADSNLTESAGTAEIDAQAESVDSPEPASMSTIQPKPASRPVRTQTDIDREGRPTLTTAPVVLDPAASPKLRGTPQR